MIRRFINQELSKSGKMTAQGVAFLANINSRLNMPKEVGKAHTVFLFKSTPEAINSTEGRDGSHRRRHPSRGLASHRLAVV